MTIRPYNKSFFVPQSGEQQHFTDRMFVRQQHGEAIHPHAESTARWHSVAHGAQIILVHGMLLLIVGGVIVPHFDKALFLIERIIQFGEGVAQFKARNITFETFDG